MQVCIPSVTQVQWDTGPELLHVTTRCLLCKIVPEVCWSAVTAGSIAAPLVGPAPTYSIRRAIFSHQKSHTLLGLFCHPIVSTHEPDDTGC